jgi:HAMP domain-containing protein
MSQVKKSLVFLFSAIVTVGLVLGMSAFAIVIGAYNQDRAIEDLKSKASNMAVLASKSLAEPVWTFDTNTMDGVVGAIWLDSDVAAIRLEKPDAKAPEMEKIRDGNGTFDAMKASNNYLINSEQIVREGKPIATIVILTSTGKVDALIKQSSILIAVFSAVFVTVLAGFIVLMARRLLKRPIDELKTSAEALAAGNLDLAINTSRGDELGSLAVSFDQMRQSIKKMLGVIEAHNRDLEEKITERTAELQHKTNDINAMLQNMRQGIFTIVAGGAIHPEYSAYLQEIFERNDIAGAAAAAFLFDNSSVQSDALDTVTATLGSIVGEDAMNFEFNSHLLCTEYTKTFPDGRRKILALDWNPVLDSAGHIAKLMVTVRDVTEFKALQIEAENQKADLEIIGQLLAVPKDKLEEFFKTSTEFLDENQQLIESTPELDQGVVATLFRNMHTVKGNARTYGFNHATDRLHEAESAYNLLRAHSSYPWDQTLLLSQLGQARDGIVLYADTYKQKLMRFVGDSGSAVDGALLDKISLAMEQINASSALVDYQQAMQFVRTTVMGLRHDTMGTVLHGIVAALPSMAKQLDKEVPELAIDDHGILIKRDFSPILRNIFMHLFRNTMDHGLESAQERVAAGKRAHGRVSLDVRLCQTPDEEGLVFDFYDDGRGLAIDKIKARAVNAGRLPLDASITDEAVAEMIFLSGVSTAETLSDVSGRGVGMDAVRNFLNKHFGDVRLEFTGPSRNGYRPFRLRITLPPSVAVYGGKGYIA